MTKNALIFLTILFFAVSCASHKGQAPEKKGIGISYHYYNKALEEIRYSHYSSALAYLDSAISVQPAYAQFYFAKGQVWELLKEPDSAMAQYETALTIRSNFPAVWERLSDLYMASGKYVKAVNMLNDLVQFQPDSLENFLMLARADLHIDQPALALDRVSYYEKRGGKSGESDFIRGKAYCQLAEYEKAAVYLSRYIKQNPSNYEAFKLLGCAYIETGDLDRGIPYINEALAMNRRDPALYLSRARYFLGKGKISSAKEQLQFVLDLDSSSCNILQQTGKLELVMKDTVAARHHLEQAVHSNSGCWEAYKYLGIIAQDAGNSADALKYFKLYRQNVLRRDPEVEHRFDKLRYKNQ